MCGTFRVSGIFWVSGIFVWVVGNFRCSAACACAHVAGVRVRECLQD